MPDAKDLVLRTRVVLLRNSLTRVNDALSDLEKCRSGPPPTDDPDEVGEHLLTSLDQVRQAIRRFVPPDAIESVLGALNVVDLTATKLVGQAKNPPSWPRLTLTDTKIRSDIEAEVSEIRRQLKLVERAADAAAEEVDEDERQAKLRATWTAYQSCWQRCRKLFNEYTDLVRGVLLRDAGLDRHLFRIADALVNDWGTFGHYAWNSFTIPTDRERHEITTAHLIRIGFPEWTVWMLPLAAGEFGHVFVKENEAMQDLEADLRAADAPAAEVQAWIADAFATTVMGPAYVWAAMLLRIDPALATDRRRVEVMLAALDQLYDPDAPPADDGELFQTLRTRTREEWDAAVAQVCAPDVEPIAPAFMAQAARVAEGVSERVGPRLAARSWHRAAALRDGLADSEVSPKEVAAQVRQGELRHLLLGGWMARLRYAQARLSDEEVWSLADRVLEAALAHLDRGPASPTLVAGSGATRPGANPYAGLDANKPSQEAGVGS